MKFGLSDSWILNYNCYYFFIILNQFKFYNYFYFKNSILFVFFNYFLYYFFIAAKSSFLFQVRLMKVVEQKNYYHPFTNFAVLIMKCFFILQIFIIRIFKYFFFLNFLNLLAHCYYYFFIIKKSFFQLQVNFLFILVIS